MKKYSYLLLFVLCLFLGINGVEAAQYDSCVEKGTCIVLCDYASQIEIGGGYENGYQHEEITRNITLYYLLDSDNLKLTWEGRERDPFFFSKTGKANSNDIFGSKVYNKTSKSMNSENFTCPKYAYTDGAALGANNEICFDDDGKTCANSSNFGTKFGTADSAFISVKQIENYNTNLSKYLDDNMFKDIASDIS